MMISKKSSAEQNETSETMGILESANGVENIKSSETDLTIKRKRLVRQEATTHHIDDKDETSSKTDTEEDNEKKRITASLHNHETEKNVKNSSALNNYDRSKKGSVRDRTQSKPAPSQSTPNNLNSLVRNETVKRKSSSKRTKLEPSNSGGRAESQENSPPCPSFSLDMSEVWQRQHIGDSPSNHSQEMIPVSAGEKLSGKTTKYEEKKTHPEVSKSSHSALQEQMFLIERSGSVRTRKGSQHNINCKPLMPQSSKQPEQKHNHLTVQPEISSNHTLQRQRRNSKDPGKSSMEPTRMTTGEGYRRLQQRDEVPAEHVRMSHGVVDPGRARHMQLHPHSSEHHSYQKIPPEFLAQSNHIEQKFTRRSKGRHAMERDGVATPNCVLLGVCLTMLFILILMLILMGSIESVPT